MKTLYALVVVLLLFMVALPGMAAGKGNAAAAKISKLKAVPQVPEPTQKGVVAWADKYYKKYEPKLEGANKETIDSIKTTLFMNKGVKTFMDDAIANLVSVLTISLSGKKSFDVLICGAALLVNTDPKNPRVINLFGAVLNAADKSKEALPVFEYGVSIRPKNPLLRLNLANAYLDADKDEKAKLILDKLSFEYPNDQAVWKSLATYYLKKKNISQFRECLFKAAKFKGYVKKKVDKKKKKIDDNAAEGSESPEQLESKIRELATSEPFTSADVLEDDYPAEAKQIRDRYCKLQGDEKWRLPKLPVCNTSTPKDYETSKPILDEWANVFGEKYTRWCTQKGAEMGVDPDESEEVLEAQAEKAADQQFEEAMKSAQDMLDSVKNVPGMDSGANKKELNDALKDLKDSAKEQGDESGEQDGNAGAPKMPLWDSGSPWAQINFRNYAAIQRTYELYFFKYYKEYNAKVQDIYKVYGDKAKIENARFDAEWEALEKEHEQNPLVDNDIPCRQAQLKHKQLMNEIALNYYHQWVNLYMPQYAQKMKPNLEAYWDVCMIYVRSMTDPKIMEREFNKVKTIFLLHASKAGPAIGAGTGFEYYPEADEEQRQLDIDIAKAREEAAVKAPQFAREFESPEFDWKKWIEDHFVIDLAIGAPGFPAGLGLKVTAKSIQFEANAIIFGGTIKYNPVDNVLETSSGLTIKNKIGLNVCGVGGEVGAKVELYKRTATWNFDKNTYTETDGGSSEVKFKLGPATAGGKLEVDSELNAKATSKANFLDAFTVQEQTKIENK